MYCIECGVFINGNFCTNCGPTSKKPKTFEQFRDVKGKSRYMKRKQDSRLTSETTIFASILKSDLRQDRGTRLPIKVDVNWDSIQLKRAVFEKFKRYNLSFSMYEIEDVKLVYKSGEIIRYIPGTKVPFTVRGYKEDLGVGYHAISVYLMPYEVSNDTDNEIDDDLNLPAFTSTVKSTIETSRYCISFQEFEYMFECNVLWKPAINFSTFATQLSFNLKHFIQY